MRCVQGFARGYCSAPAKENRKMKRSVNPNPIKRELGKDFCLICQTEKSKNPEHVIHLGKEKVVFFFQIEIRQSNPFPLSVLKLTRTR